jgi:hypothetical protein
MLIPVIALPEFLQSTRHAGYQSPAHAVAELVDNAIQAGGTRISVRIDEGPSGFELSVEDDGAGMDAATLAAALRFGGSARYGDRSGLGRFGMGLPTSSLSVARRVDVYTWRGDRPLHLSLDLDALLNGSTELPPVDDGPAPVSSAPRGGSGTLIRWTRCDRLEGTRLGAAARDLSASLGRTFRRFIWDGLSLTVNGQRCPPHDPLLVEPRAPFSGAALFGESLRVPVRTALGRGEVLVRFSELPVKDWHGLSLTEKRRVGITKGSGVYVMRAGREIDAGWLFMGDKRRESYDDWWRCELEFHPALDEAFGLTYTKQQVRPTPELVEALTPELSAVAHALNARVRRAHKTLQVRARYAASEAKATEVEARLRPLPAADAARSPLLERLSASWPDVLTSPARPDIRIVEEDLGPAPLFEVVRVPNRLVVVWNTAHPFYARAYAPLAASDEPGSAERRAQLELLLVALARAEVAGGSGGEVEAFRQAWSVTLAELVKE